MCLYINEISMEYNNDSLHTKLGYKYVVGDRSGGAANLLNC